MLFALLTFCFNITFGFRECLPQWDNLNFLDRFFFFFAVIITLRDKEHSLLDYSYFCDDYTSNYKNNLFSFAIDSVNLQSGSPPLKKEGKLLNSFNQQRFCPLLIAVIFRGASNLCREFCLHLKLDSVAFLTDDGGYTSVTIFISYLRRFAFYSDWNFLSAYQNSRHKLDVSNLEEDLKKSLWYWL